jgi:hypothetical protein
MTPTFRVGALVEALLAPRVNFGQSDDGSGQDGFTVPTFATGACVSLACSRRCQT